MQSIIQPWKEGPSIFHFVQEHIDEQGVFTATELPDAGEYAAPSSLLKIKPGATDAYYTLIADANDEDEAQEKAQELLTRLLKDPSATNQEKLYSFVIEHVASSYTEALLDLLCEEDPPAFLYSMAVEWLHNSPHREAIKFAIFLCFSLDFDRPDLPYAPDLLKDFTILACCEEFSFFALLALRKNSPQLEETLWHVIEATRGWGRIHALRAATFTTPAQRDWLLRHSSELTVTYPPISLLFIREGQLLDALAAPTLDPELYTNIASILNTYLLFLLEDDPTDHEVPPQLGIPTKRLFTLFLGHAAQQIKVVEDLQLILKLHKSLLLLEQLEHWNSLTANDCHLLLSQLEQLLYSKDWLPELLRKLETPEGSINYTMATLAYKLHYNIYPQLFALLQKYPQETTLYQYLLRMASPAERAELLAFACARLNEYKQQVEALASIVAPLQAYPGEGEELICAALTCFYDIDRSAALTTLEAWQVEQLSPALRAALFQALQLSQTPLQHLRIDALLSGDIFDKFSALAEAIHPELKKLLR